MTGRALRLLRIGLNVADLEQAKAYYHDVLGFATIAEEDADPNWARLLAGEACAVRTARLGLGDQQLDLTAFDPPGAKYPPDSNAADLWFQHFAIVTNDMADACGRLTRHGAVPISRGGPQRLPPTAGAMTAYKFRDPDGHPLELIQFPPGIGDPRWQSAAPGPTLGIDHSALSVSDAARSLAFYRCLGLEPASQQINSGPQQDRLDGLSHVIVDVIGLAPAAEPTPHVELLCYRRPRGRPPNPDRRPSDLADSRLILQVENLTDLVRALASAGAAPAPVRELASGVRAASVRDPDGHAIVLHEFR